MCCESTPELLMYKKMHNLNGFLMLEAYRDGVFGLSVSKCANVSFEMK